jgi:tRNA(fMet)-specific endonuclease VapC
MRRPAQLAHRFIQFVDQLAIPTIVLAELYAGAYSRPDPSRLLELIEDLARDVHVLEFDAACAQRFGAVRGQLRQQGVAVNTVDLMIAAVALVHDLTLVTHNTADYRQVPGLRLDDWLRP